MKKLFLILSVLLLNSCGSLISASLTETIFNPTSIASNLIDYEIKKHTGKKMSEHALSKATDKDCEINIENLSNPQSFCKDKEVAESNITTPKVKVALQKQNNKSSLASIVPKLKTVSVEKSSPTNEILALSNSPTPSDIILKIHKKNNVTKFIKCSSSLKFCLIASGEFDIYAATARAKEWDIAAGHAIAEHAGAILTTFSGKKITYGKKDFANPALLLKRSNNLMK